VRFRQSVNLKFDIWAIMWRWWVEEYLHVNGVFILLFNKLTSAQT